ncbi:hypothetical protein GCM10009743_32440 [Kribbella swartbergensis]
MFQKLGGAAVPVVTLGAGSPVMFGILAVRRRSFRLAASAGVYLATAVGFWGTDWNDDVDSTKADVVMTCLVLSVVAASVQAAVVIGAPRVDRRAAGRRLEARRLAAERPDTARILGIGRPDLPRTYDDGGLVDLNDAPVEVLCGVPGLNPQLAAAIVSSRTLSGRFRRVDELWTRGLLTAPPGPDLFDRLIVIDVQDRR